jgi:hypothetical protein
MLGARRWIGLVVVLHAGIGCGDESEDGECFNYSGWDGTSPTVSLRADLLNDGTSATVGLFRRACSASTCHGSETRSKGQLYLGPSLATPITEAQIQLVLTNLIGAQAKTNGDVMRVVPFDPQSSFLMRKLDDCYEGISGGCQALAGHITDNPCGDRMPQASKLSINERNKVRRWIAQGALPD